MAAKAPMPRSKADQREERRGERGAHVDAIGLDEGDAAVEVDDALAGAAGDEDSGTEDTPNYKCGVPVRDLSGAT